jgi:prophage regulatory protein
VSSITEINKHSRRKAQVPLAKKAAALKAANEAKRPQPIYLQRPILNAAKTRKTPALTPERVGEAHQSQGPPRLMSKHEVLAVVGCTYPTLWAMMRRGEFPRSRIVGRIKSAWLSTEIEQWMAALPMRRLKGD